MTPSYKQIQKKIEALQRQADKLKATEVDGVISRIKVAVAHYGLTAAQLGFGPSATAGRGNWKNSAARYGDGQGNQWSGRGPRPHWLRDALATGRSLEEFATGAAPAKASAGGPARRKLAKRRPSSVIYRDAAGHSWTGRGPKPGWLKDAIAGGKSMQDFAHPVK